MLELILISGFSCVLIISSTFKYNFFPKLPPGWYFAKSLDPKPLSFNSVTAKASPITNWAVVLVVGAKLFGHASFSTLEFKIKSAFSAKKESISPVIAINLFELLDLIKGISALISCKNG